MTVKIDGKTLRARPLTADEWFDALDLEKRREQDYKLISIGIVDEKGNQAYSPDVVGKLPVTDYAKLYGLVLTVNHPEKDSKN